MTFGMAFVDPFAALRPVALASFGGRPTVMVGGRAHAIAPTGSRVLAAILDVVAYRALCLCLVPLWFTSGALHAATGSEQAGAPALVAALYFAVTFAFWGPATYWGSGQSPGKRLMGLRVVGADGQSLTFPAVIVREWLWRAVPLAIVPLHLLPGSSDIAFLAVGCAAVLAGSRAPTAQALADRISKTVVIVHDPIPLRAPGH